MKPKSRFLGIDDAPFRFGESRVPVVGVVVQAPAYIEGLLVTDAEVDGTDGTERIVAMIRRSRYREGLAMVLVNGAAVGGFNILDVDALHEAAEVPVVTITRRKPDMASIEKALRHRFTDWQERLAILRKHGVEAMPTKHNPLYVTYVGAGRGEVREALALTTVRGALPESLRVAHLVGTAIVRGESHGRA